MPGSDASLPVSHDLDELRISVEIALEEVMTKVPLEYSSSSTKAYLAECILKAAAQGQTSYDQLVAAAAEQIDQIQVVLLPFI